VCLHAFLIRRESPDLDPRRWTPFLWWFCHNNGGERSGLLLPWRVLWSTPHMLDSLSTRSREIILANMRQSVSLTLKILKSLYPQADMDAVGKGFMATCSDEEALKLVEDSTMTARQIVDYNYIKCFWTFPPCSYTIMNGSYSCEFMTCLTVN
jgi:hypothetical protein